MNFIFIDTNLYRDLLRSETMSSNILGAIEKLIIKHSYSLILPKQVIDEITRGRFQDWFAPKELTDILALKKILDEKKDDFDLGPDSQSLLEKVNQMLSNNDEDNAERKNEILGPDGYVEKNFNKLKSLAIIVNDSKDLMDSASLRTIKGNPPYEISDEKKKQGKLNTKICDAYIWEQIKHFFKEKKETKRKLLFYSKNTNDWCVGKGEECEFHPFLKKEMLEELNVDILFYTSLDEIPNLTEIEKQSIQSESLDLVKQDIYENFISGLLTSNRWDFTDELFDKYSDYIEKLSEEDVAEILKASVENNQVSIGPYNQVLLASKATNFFSRLYKYSVSKGFSFDPWLKFYENMDSRSKEKYENLKKALIKHNYYYDEADNEFMFIPF